MSELAPLADRVIPLAVIGACTVKSPVVVSETPVAPPLSAPLTVRPPVSTRLKPFAVDAPRAPIALAAPFKVTPLIAKIVRTPAVRAPAV